MPVLLPTALPVALMLAELPLLVAVESMPIVEVIEPLMEPVELAIADALATAGIMAGAYAEQFPLGESGQLS